MCTAYLGTVLVHASKPLHARVHAFTLKRGAVRVRTALRGTCKMRMNGANFLLFSRFHQKQKT